MNTGSDSFEETANTLKAGGLAIYPTETFMALGCRALHATAVQRIYAAKQRSSRLPLPLIVADMEQLCAVARLPAEAQPLIERFWPGPLTLLLPVLPQVPPAVSGSTALVAVRIPGHAGARALAGAVGEALVASSANISGQPAAARLEELDRQLRQRVDAVWNGSPRAAGGLPSTLVRLAGQGRIQIARQGAVTQEALQAAGFIVQA